MVEGRMPEIDGAFRNNRNGVIILSAAPCGHSSPCGCEQATGELKARSCCLQCPFEVCVLDEPTSGRQQAMLAVRREKIRKVKAWRRKGLTYAQIAPKLNLSTRTVVRMATGQ